MSQDKFILREQKLLITFFKYDVVVTTLY